MESRENKQISEHQKPTGAYYTDHNSSISVKIICALSNIPERDSDSSHYVADVHEDTIGEVHRFALIGDRLNTKIVTNYS